MIMFIRGVLVLVVVGIALQLGTPAAVHAQSPGPCQYSAYTGQPCNFSWLPQPPVVRWPFDCNFRVVDYDIVAGSFDCNERYHPDDYPNNCNQDKYDTGAWINAINIAAGSWNDAYHAMSYGEDFFNEVGASEVVKVKGLHFDKFLREGGETDWLAMEADVSQSVAWYEGQCYQGPPCFFHGMRNSRIYFNFKFDFGFQDCGVGNQSKARNTAIHEFGHVIGFEHDTGSSSVMSNSTCPDWPMQQDGYALYCLYYDWLHRILPYCSLPGCS